MSFASISSTLLRISTVDTCLSMPMFDDNSMRSNEDTQTSAGSRC